MICDQEVNLNIQIKNSKFSYTSNNTNIPLLYPQFDFTPTDYIISTEINGTLFSNNLTIISDYQTNCLSSIGIYSYEHLYIALFVKDKCNVLPEVFKTTLATNEYKMIMQLKIVNGQYVYYLDSSNQFFDQFIQTIEIDTNSQLDINFFVSPIYHLNTSQIFIPGPDSLEEVLQENYKLPFQNYGTISYTSQFIIVKLNKRMYNLQQNPSNLILVQLYFENNDILYQYSINVTDIRQQLEFKCEFCIDKVFFGEKNAIIQKSILILNLSNVIQIYNLTQQLDGLLQVQIIIQGQNLQLKLSTQNNLITQIDNELEILFFKNNKFQPIYQSYHNHTFFINFNVEKQLIKKMIREVADIQISFQGILYHVDSFKIVSNTRVYCYSPIFIIAFITALFIIK